MNSTLYAVLLALVLGVGCGKGEAGIYECWFDGKTGGFILRDNGTAESLENGKTKAANLKWVKIDNKIHIEEAPNHKNESTIFRINPDGSITLIKVTNKGSGKEFDVPEKLQLTFKKIK
jgi:hypothetical protein